MTGSLKTQPAFSDLGMAAKRCSCQRAIPSSPVQIIVSRPRKKQTMISLTVGVSLKPKWAMIRLRSRRKRPLTAAEFAGRPDLPFG